MPDSEPPGPLDSHEVIDLFEEFLFGEHPTLTGLDIADRVGIPMETARERWRSLGFSAVEDDEVAFTTADLRAMEVTEKLHTLGLLDEDSESSLIRTLGRSFARLAEWELAMLGRAFDPRTSDHEELVAVASEVIPMVEEVQSFVWRRHLLSAASRLLLAPPDEEGAVPLAVGFADIVDYTRQSRSLKRNELAQLVDRFEDRALGIITAHGGRIIKTIGDEVLFVADEPAEGARIALELVEQHLVDDESPRLRVGLAYGPVLARLGDVFGPTVNVASRLTSLSKPGKVLTDRGLAEALADDEDFRVKRRPRASVKGYRRLEPWSLRRPRDPDAASRGGKLPRASAQMITEHGKDLVRAVDELQMGRKRAAPRKDAE